MKEMIGGCCVCLDDKGYDENPIVYCDGHGCNVAVHQACYGIITVPTGPWFCRKCESQERAARVRCELCPQKEGALKRTDIGGWCHVVCALYIPEVSFGSINSMEPIILKKVPQDRFNKSCYICEEQGRANKASTGACMQCNYRTGCKHHFHVTCAQSMGLLREESGTKKKVSYCGYCSHHFKKLFSAQKKESLQKVIKIEGEFPTDKLKLDKPKLGEPYFNEYSPSSVKLEPSSIRIPGKFTNANFTESLLEEPQMQGEDPQKNCDQYASSSDASKQIPTDRGMDVVETPPSGSETFKPYVTVTSEFAKASSSSSSVTTELFAKLSHPLLPAINPISDSSSSTCSFPSFGQYMSPSRPNDFSEIKPDNSSTFGNVCPKDSDHGARLFKADRKKLKVERKSMNPRGRKPKEQTSGDPPLLTSPPPPSDFTNLSESPLLHPHNSNSFHKRNQQQQQQQQPWIPFPSSTSHHHYSPPVYDLDSLGGNLESLPTSMEDLLESQWRLGSQFLMQQGQRLDIVDLLNLLHQTKEKNRQMEKSVEELTSRRNYLVATNARLAMSVMGGSSSDDQTTKNNNNNNKSPTKKEAHLESSHGNQESNDLRVGSHPPPKSSQQQQQQHQQQQQQHQQQQQSAYSFISNGLVNVNSTPPPLSINHLLQQPINSPHLPHSNPIHSFNNNNNMDKMAAEHLRRQQQKMNQQLTQEQHNKMQQMQQQQQQPQKDHPPTNLPYVGLPTTPHPFYPVHLPPREQQLYAPPQKNTAKKQHILPKDK